ncbi:hypothetical protein D3C80_1746770 [compost metagenome]
MNATCFHFEQFFFPLKITETGEVKLTYNRNKRLAVAGHIVVRKTKGFSFWVRAAVCSQFSLGNFKLRCIGQIKFGYCSHCV